MSKYNLSEFFEEKKEIRELFFEFMKEQFTRFIETLSVGERNAYCEKTGDNKNGFYERKFDTMFGKIIDGTFLRLRRDIVFKEVVYTVMGISEEGHKEILDFRLMGGSGESSINWKEVLANLKNRGLESPLVVVGDGLQGLREAVFEVYPEADFQLCILHKVKSSLAKVKKRDEKAVYLYN